MENNIAISVKNVKKIFKVHYDKGTSLKEKILFRERNRYEEREVIKGISFDVKKGEAIGLIGENGCGKSTMLKMLTKIMYPTEGTVETKGRISALIELGAGFHPDMSGRENIYTNAAIFGLTRREIDERLEKIIEFSELGDRIDNPVRTYSSGMYMRLAFSVAINVEADILLIDEILAVGDAAFQAKCFNRLREIKGKGVTIVIVSHSLGQIEQICDRSIWICNGRIKKVGNPRDVHIEYLDYMGEKKNSLLQEKQKGEELEKNNESTIEKENKKVHLEKKETVSNENSADNPNRWGSKEAEILNVRLMDEKQNEKSTFCTDETLQIAIDYVVHNKLIEPACGIGIFRNDGLQCYGTNTFIDGITDAKLEKKGTVLFLCKKNMLLPGEYTIDVAIHTNDGFAYDYFRYSKKFTVYSNKNEVGIFRMEHEWKFY